MHQLNNNHNVYILGAGFSVDRGLPVIRNFMVVMRDAHQWLESKGRNREAEAIKAVLDFRLDAASAAYRVKLDLENIEELFSLASASSRVLAKKIQLAIAATLDYKIQTTSEPKIGFNTGNSILTLPTSWIQKHSESWHEVECPAYEFYLKALIGNWNNENNLNSNSIITFNYDLLVEDALTSLSIPYDYAVGGKKSSSESYVELLKLHGSINWGEKAGSNTSYETENKSYEELLKNGQTPQLVPPTWRKIFTGPLRNIWDNSIQSLEKATRIIVIGFSMPATDSHFKYLMAAGLQKNISLREIVFVNPDGANLEQKAKALFGDATIVGQASTTSPIVKIISCSLSSFLSQGNIAYSINMYGRPMPAEIQQIHLKQ